MADHLYTSETPSEVKDAKGLHLITMGMIEDSVSFGGKCIC